MELRKVNVNKEYLMQSLVEDSDTLSTFSTTGRQKQSILTSVQFMVTNRGEADIQKVAQDHSLNEYAAYATVIELIGEGKLMGKVDEDFHYREDNYQRMPKKQKDDQENRKQLDSTKLLSSKRPP